MKPAAAPTVFVVDDDDLVRAAIQGMLKSVGLRSETFGTAQEFLRSKRTDGPSCLILDVRLPGISGLDFQRELADAGIRIPIIFITGHGDIPMTVKAMKSGAVEFLTKPFRDQDLLDAINQALQNARRVIAVGTTTVRALEHAVRAGAGAGSIAAGAGAADLFIYPGFEFKVVKAMLTNFHLPQSSLLMLVSAFGGKENILRGYQHAVSEKYRFYSYGDCMFID